MCGVVSLHGRVGPSEGGAGSLCKFAGFISCDATPLGIEDERAGSPSKFAGFISYDIVDADSLQAFFHDLALHVTLYILHVDSCRGWLSLMASDKNNIAEPN